MQLYRREAYCRSSFTSKKPVLGSGTTNTLRTAFGLIASMNHDLQMDSL